MSRASFTTSHSTSPVAVYKRPLQQVHNCWTSRVVTYDVVYTMPTYTIPVAVPVVVVITMTVTSIGLTDMADRHALTVPLLSITVMAISVNPTSTK